MGRGRPEPVCDVPLLPVSLTQRLKNKTRRFLERPGTTLDLRRFSGQLPDVEARGEDLTELDDAAFAAARLVKCTICSHPIALETAKADEDGDAVHEGCYVVKLRAKSRSAVTQIPL